MLRSMCLNIFELFDFVIKNYFKSGSPFIVYIVSLFFVPVKNNAGLKATTYKKNGPLIRLTVDFGLFRRIPSRECDERVVD